MNENIRISRLKPNDVYDDCISCPFNPERTGIDCFDDSGHGCRWLAMAENEE